MRAALDPDTSCSWVAAPSGPVALEGVLQPDEPPAQSAPDGDRLGSLDVADLVNRWGTPIYNGFVVLVSQRADVRAGAAQPQLVPPPAPQAHGIAWRNAAYAVQWWVFAAFAVFMWFRMVREDAGRDGD